MSSSRESWRSSSSNWNFTSGMLAIHSHCTYLKSTSMALFCFVMPFLWGSSNVFLISEPLRAILCSRKPTYRVAWCFENFGTGLALLIPLDFLVSVQSWLGSTCNCHFFPKPSTYSFSQGSNNFLSLDLACAVIVTSSFLISVAGSCPSFSWHWFSSESYVCPSRHITFSFWFHRRKIKF